MYRKVYAYAITVVSRKVQGGTVHADSMDDAVKKLSQGNDLEIKYKGCVIRPCDGASIHQADWYFRGEKAFVYVYAPPEYFI